MLHSLRHVPDGCGDQGEGGQLKVEEEGDGGQDNLFTNMDIFINIFFYIRGFWNKTSS